MKGLLNFFHKIEPDKKKSPFLHTVYDGFFTFLFVPNHVTSKGAHVKDRMDLKRLMIFVVLALMACYVFGAYNTGHYHYAALGQYTELTEGIGPKLWYGLLKILPILVVTMAVGLGIEFYYAARKGHGIEEGFIVSGMLIPLIMPPDLPLWMLALAVVFAVILGKEAFGGTGMNILNVALLTRVFIFFAYPTFISGDEVWISGVAGVDGVTGATPLALAAKGGWEAVTAVYSESQMWWGFIPGSIGETSKPLIILGALFLIFTRVASWRIMFSMLLGAAFVAMLMNGFAPEITADSPGVFKFMAVPWYYQFYMGSFFFAMAFMATDPVTASGTNKGKWIYGFLIGSIGMVIRIINPAYPEGWMLAILLLNVFAPTIDHFVVEGNMKRRAKRAEAIA